MHPRLIEIPFLHVTIWSFGPAMALGFLMGFVLVRRLSQRAGLNPSIMSDAVLYCLLVGIVGARTFFVIHHFDLFREDLLGVVAIWRGGLEFIGGVIPAIGLLLFYLHRCRQPVRRYLDIMAIGLMLGLAFGRIGCFMNGCCFGKPTDLPWGIRFPYRSFAYYSQSNPNPQRNRPRAQLRLPSEYFSSIDADGTGYLKPYGDLTTEQKAEATKGRYRCLAVHPTQLYSSAKAALLCLILYLFWRRGEDASKARKLNKPFAKPGVTFALAFILYGVARFLMEMLRDDNPFEIDHLTVSQLFSLLLIVCGVVLMAVLVRLKPVRSQQSRKPGDEAAEIHKQVVL